MVRQNWTGDLHCLSQGNGKPVTRDVMASTAGESCQFATFLAQRGQKFVI